MPKVVESVWPTRVWILDPQTLLKSDEPSPRRGFGDGPDPLVYPRVFDRSGQFRKGVSGLLKKDSNTAIFGLRWNEPSGPILPLTP